MEGLVTCNRCQGNACLENYISEDKVKTWFCFGCGFTSNEKLTKDSQALEQILHTQPELYKDLVYIDKHNRGWLPATVTLPGIGIVFLDGSNIENWGWSAAKAVRIEEQERYRFPEDQEFKIDYNNKVHYGKKDFMDALEYIGFFKQLTYQEETK